MQELPLGRLFATYQKLSAACQMLTSFHQEQKGVLLNGPDYEELLRDAEEFATLCKATSLDVTHGAALRVSQELRERPTNQPGGGKLFDIQAVARCHNALDQLIGCMRHETPNKAAVVLTGEEVDLYDPKTPLFGNDVSTKFPRISFEIDEAAKCAALGRATACVFHLMRTLEAGLNAVRGCLNVPPPSNPNWGNILNPIEARIRALGRAHGEHAYFEELHGRLDVIRRAWRNGTMHVEIVYTPEDARILFEATKGLMKKIASRMDEHGQPPV